jgi:YD repeat-containing protein
MRKIAALSVILVLVLSGTALAGGDKTHEAAITKVDSAGKVMTVKDKSGKETEIYWTDSTKLAGKAMAEGETVHYKAKMENGKLTAYWVHVGALEEKHSKKPSY